MNKMTVRDVDLTGKRVLVRVDFNVPLAGDKITDDTRIRAALPSIRYILSCQPKAIVLMSHLGRPKGERKTEMSLAPVSRELAELLGLDVAFVGDCIGHKVVDAIEALSSGGIILLENTRFHKGETKNDSDFAANLSRNGDVFVNDAFGTAHRAHASNVGVAAHLPAVCGSFCWRSRLITSPQRLKSRSGPLSPSSVAPRFLARLMSLNRCWTK